jgi:hypothetical protein
VSGRLSGDALAVGPGVVGAPGSYRQAIMVLRWFRDAALAGQLALDDEVSGSAAYRYLHEAIDVLAAAARACTTRCWPLEPPGTAICTWSGT